MSEENTPPPGWRIVDGHRLEKEYTFPNFADGLAFVNKVGAVAEEMEHHPDIYLAWGKVRIQTWTHTANGLTQKDFTLAERIESRL